MDWFLLGIAPTKDKKAITAAYREKLRQTNPEDKPEEFKALRQAYEEALSLANTQEQSVAVDDSPVGRWMEDIKKLYQNYPQRIDPKCWKLLMESPVCVALDTRPVAEEALLKFLMEDYYLPRSVWAVLNETFDFSDRAEELYDAWPREFIDCAVLSGIRTEPALDYYLFTPGKNATDCDTYRKLYTKANQMKLSDVGPVLEQLEALTESHPFGVALRCRYWMETGKPDEGREGFAALVRSYPDHPLLVSTWADICVKDGNVEEAERLSAHILSIDPANIDAKIVAAKCLAQRKQYHQAKEYLYDVVRSADENPLLASQLIERIQQWNELLIAEREAQYAAQPEDTDNAVELAWCYIQNERQDEALALAKKIDPKCEDQYAYHNLMGKLMYHSGKYEQALEHLSITEQIIRSLQDDGTEQTRKRMTRLPEMLQIQGSCLMQLGRNAEAWEKFELALSDDPENVDILSTMGRILYTTGDYQAAVDVLQRLLRITSGAWFETLLAMCLYRLHRDREAFDAVERGLMLPDWDLTLYLLKMQILCRNGAYDGVREILDYMKENNAPEDISLDFIRTELIHLDQKDEATALKQYRTLAERIDAGEALFFREELFYHLAVLTGNQLDVSLEENRKSILRIVDQGLEKNPQDADLLAYKAWVLKRGGLLEEAIEMYRSLLQKNPNATTALRGMADLYYEDIGRYGAQALECYEKLLEIQRTPELYYFAATCKWHMQDFAGAKEYYLKELELDPDDMDAYRGLAFVYDALADYQKSLQMLDSALEIMEQFQQRNHWIVNHKANVLRRMGRYEEALAFAQDARQRYHYGDALQTQFDICCQFGLWDLAKQVLETWKNENRNDPQRMAAKARLCLLQDKMLGAAFAMGTVKHKLSYDRVEDFRLQLADLESNHTRKIQILSYRVNRDRTDDHALVQLAHSYWLAGEKDAAKGAAGKALALLDEILKQNLTDAPLYRTRRSLALAILERTEEAIQELAKCRQLPLCDFCEYGRCKDADVFEAYIAEILGDTQQATKCYAAGKRNWPDELDFVAGEKRMNKKGRK